MNMPNPEFEIYLSSPHLSGGEFDAVRRAMESNWVAPAGPLLGEFECAVAQNCGIDYATAVNSGTAAIHLALRAVGVGPGDDVLCPTFTFVACANPIRYLGARPVFIDADPATWNIDPHLVARELDRRARGGRLPKAVICADLYGQCVDADPLFAACSEHGVPLVEDAAEALGARYRDRPAGSLGDIAALSFNGNKIITTSGGGMVLSNNKAWIERAAFWATQAREPGLAQTHHDLGYNYRLSNVLAALGLAQLRLLQDRVAARRTVFERYRHRLGDLPGVTFMPEPDGFMSTRWLTCLLIDASIAGISSAALCERLHAAGIEARPVWQPLQDQKLFRESPAVGGDVARRLARDGISLPSGSNLTPAQQERIITVILAAVQS